jgi:FAD dependent oxidoreductase TIGR03364
VPSRNLHVDLIVVGGGILGAFHAYHALVRGLSVVLLERDAAPRGATTRNFGQVVPSGLGHHWQRFGRQSLKIYEFLQTVVDLSVKQQGSIYIASDQQEKTLLEELHAINASNGYHSKLWTAKQCQQRYPLLRSTYCKAGLFFPQELSVNPQLMIHNLHQFLSQQPRFTAHFQSCVRELRVTSGRGVEAETTQGHTLSAEKVIVCCGSEFQTLYPELFATSDLQLVKLQMLRLREQPESALPGNILTGRSIRRYESFAQCPSWAQIQADEPADSFAKQWGVHILFKQEADGTVILGDSHEYAPAAVPEGLNHELRAEVNHFFIAEAKKIMNLPHWDVESIWYGMYCQTQNPSGIFTRSPENNIHIVTGIGGKGMTSAAGFAEHSLTEILS